MCAGRYVCLMAIAAAALRAQTAEPILTRLALPFAPGAGGIKLEYAGGIGSSGGSSQVIPEATLEAGIVNGWEILLRLPLLRVRFSADSTAIGGGQLAFGARRLLTGGARRSYAVSLQAVVETPTGDRRLVGDATQVMPALLADWQPVRKLVVHSNLTFDRSVGGTRPAAFLESQNAVVWRPGGRVVPVFELVSSTNTLQLRTQAIAQPELIVRAGAHLEWKAGLQLGLNSATPSVGLRLQLAILWGRRE